MPCEGAPLHMTCIARNAHLVTCTIKDLNEAIDKAVQVAQH